MPMRRLTARFALIWHGISFYSALRARAGCLDVRVTDCDAQRRHSLTSCVSNEVALEQLSVVNAISQGTKMPINVKGAYLLLALLAALSQSR
jgi:hypothetical protein